VAVVLAVMAPDLLIPGATSAHEHLGR
jgi:hypothetical protein